MTASVVVRECGRCHEALGPVRVPDGCRVRCGGCALVEGASVDDLAAAAALAMPELTTEQAAAAVRALAADMRRRAIAAVN